MGTGIYCVMYGFVSHLEFIFENLAGYNILQKQISKHTFQCLQWENDAVRIDCHWWKVQPGKNLYLFSCHVLFDCTRKRWYFLCAHLHHAEGINFGMHIEMVHSYFSVKVSKDALQSWFTVWFVAQWQQTRSQDLSTFPTVWWGKAR